MDKLRQSLLESPIIEKGEYEYFVHPISDGVPMLRPGLLREIVIRIIRKAEIADVNKIVTPAAMGIHISTAVSLMTDIPIVVIRKRRYGLDGEVSLSKQTGYSESEMYINDVSAGDRVLVLDDVLSTGGTMRAVLDALEQIGADIVALRSEGSFSTMHSPNDPLKSMNVKPFRTEALLKHVMKDGEQVKTPESVQEIAAYARDQLNRLEPEYKRFDNSHIYKVGLSGKLYELRHQLITKNKST